MFKRFFCKMKQHRWKSELFDLKTTFLGWNTILFCATKYLFWMNYYILLLVKLSFLDEELYFPVHKTIFLGWRIFSFWVKYFHFLSVILSFLNWMKFLFLFEKLSFPGQKIIFSWLIYFPFLGDKLSFPVRNNPRSEL